MNGGITFDRPWALAALAVLIPFLILDLLHRRSNPEGVEFPLLPGRGANKKTGNVSMVKFRLRCTGSHLCFFCFLVCMIIALAGPCWGSRRVVVYSRGLDLVLALDLSRSMAVRDAAPIPRTGAPPETGKVSRLDRALALAASLAARARGIRAGAAIGRGRGVLAVPLTYDAEGLLNFLEGLRDTAITGTGTNLEALVDAAAGAFQDTFPSRQVIVLLSDGEALSGSLTAAAGRVREAGIILCALGLGTETGGPVPLDGGTAGEEGVLTDETGSPVVSSRRDGVLRDAAALTGGIYLDGNRNDAAAVLGEYLDSLTSGIGPGSSRLEPGSRWHIFVAAGLLFWGLSRALGLTRRRREGGVADA